MQAGFTITHEPIWNNDVCIVIFNYHNSNVVQHVPVAEKSSILQNEKRVGVWKIKKLKN